MNEFFLYGAYELNGLGYFSIHILYAHGIQMGFSDRFNSIILLDTDISW